MQNKVLSMSKYLRPIIYVKMVNISLGTIHKTKTIQEIVCERKYVLYVFVAGTAKS